MLKIWIVWKVNVWKSTLFNRLFNFYKAIVTDIQWTTRETIWEEGELEWFHIRLSDTPWVIENYEAIEGVVKDSDIVLFVTDLDGWNAKDDKIKSIILDAWKFDQTIFVINKIDTWDYAKKEKSMLEYYEHGFENIVWVWAKNWFWIADLREKIIFLAKKFDFPLVEYNPDQNRKFVIVGRPNVWKSSLFNKISWEKIAEVSEIAWTTLDYLTYVLNHKWVPYKFYDTAWVRRNSKNTGIERIALEKTRHLIDSQRPIIVVMIDWSQWVVHRDLTLVDDMTKFNLPMMIVVNKSDLDQQNLYMWFDWIPRVWVSAKTGYWVSRMFEMLDKIYNWFTQTIPTSVLNKVLQDAWISNPPKFPKNKICRFYYATQIQHSWPKFIFFINDEKKANFSFKRWIENVLRKNFGFLWVPIEIEFKSRDDEKKKKEKSQRPKTLTPREEWLWGSAIMSAAERKERRIRKIEILKARWIDVNHSQKWKRRWSQGRAATASKALGWRRELNRRKTTIKK